MNYATGAPVWTWPEWRKAASGTRFRHNQSGRYGTFIKPSRSRHNGAIVRWDGHPETSNVVAPARDLTPVRIKAWDLIGFDSHADTISDEFAEALGEGTLTIKVRGGRSQYEAVLYNDATARSNNVRLARLEIGSDGIHEVARYVHPDTELEIIAHV